MALFALFRSPRGFPKQPEWAQRRAAVHIVGGRAQWALDALAPGPFAVSVLHDEDGDRRLDTGLFGIPSEGIGFSRDVMGTFGPPDFDDAMLRLPPGGKLSVTLRMRYY